MLQQIAHKTQNLIESKFQVEAIWPDTKLRQRELQFCF